MKHKQMPFEILDATVFYEDNEKRTLMRQLYRMDYDEETAQRIFESWMTRRNKTIELIAHVVDCEEIT
jgi:phage terminase large subunit-like protein